jgi:hypothetical protein
MSDVVLWLATFCYLVVCGAGSYEHAVIVPAWTSNPPSSIAMFHGPYALDLGRWWLKVHPVNLLLLLAALWLLRRQARRKYLAFAVGGHLLVLAATALYFVPELFALTMHPDAGLPAAEWKARADTWEILSLARLACMLLFGGALLRAVSEPPTARGSVTTHEAA